jgi:hypothetical protein
MLHYLRIAVTAPCLTVCVLLIGLWVRSYGWTDQVVGIKPNSPVPIGIVSEEGELALVTSTYFSEVWDISTWEIRSEKDYRFLLDTFFGFAFFHEHRDIGLVIPHWFVALVFMALAAAPWIHRLKRFSLRTLLIATTLVAIVLAVVIYLAR